MTLRMFQWMYLEFVDVIHPCLIVSGMQVLQTADVHGSFGGSGG